MIAKYNGYCQYQDLTNCGGIHKGDEIIHAGKKNSFHYVCRTQPLNDSEIYELMYEHAYQKQIQTQLKLGA